MKKRSEREGGGEERERAEDFASLFFFSKSGGERSYISVRKAKSCVLVLLMSSIPSTSVAGDRLMKSRDSQVTLNLALRERRRNRQCSSLSSPSRPLRHLCASNSDPISTREASHETKDLASRIKKTKVDEERCFSPERDFAVLLGVGVGVGVFSTSSSFSLSTRFARPTTPTRATTTPSTEARSPTCWGSRD